MASKDYQWFLTTDLKAYQENEYIVVIDQEIVAHTKDDLKNILDEVRKKYPEKTPFVAKVPSSEALILVIVRDSLCHPERSEGSKGY